MSDELINWPIVFGVAADGSEEEGHVEVGGIDELSFIIKSLLCLDFIVAFPLEYSSIDFSFSLAVSFLSCQVDTGDLSAVHCESVDDLGSTTLHVDWVVCLDSSVGNNPHQLLEISQWFQGETGDFGWFGEVYLVVAEEVEAAAEIELMYIYEYLLPFLQRLGHEVKQH